MSFCSLHLYYLRLKLVLSSVFFDVMSMNHMFHNFVENCTLQGTAWHQFFKRLFDMLYSLSFALVLRSCSFFTRNICTFTRIDCLLKHHVSSACLFIYIYTRKRLRYHLGRGQFSLTRPHQSLCKHSLTLYWQVPFVFLLKKISLKNGNFFWNETYEKQQWYPDEKHQWYPVIQPPFPKNRSKKIKFISKRN